MSKRGTRPPNVASTSTTSTTSTRSIAISNLVTSNLAERRGLSSPAALSIQPLDFQFSKPVRPPTFDAGKHETDLTRTIQNLMPMDDFALYRKGNEIFWSEKGVRPIQEQPILQILGILLWNEQGAFCPFPMNVVAFRCMDGILRQISGEEMHNAKERSFVDFDGDHRSVETLEVVTDDERKTQCFQVVPVEELPQAAVTEKTPRTPNASFYEGEKTSRTPNASFYEREKTPPTPPWLKEEKITTTPCISSPSYAPVSPGFVVERVKEAMSSADFFPNV